MTMWTAGISSPAGTLTAYASDEALLVLLWPGLDVSRFGLPRAAVACPGHPLLARLAAQLDEYFAGTRRHFDLPLDPRGTAFQREAWAALTEIPFGATRSYSGQAARLGRPAAARAVGAANGRNPLAIVVPCHRVVGRDGRLTGFAGGLARKRLLLEHEAEVVRRGACAPDPDRVSQLVPAAPSGVSGGSSRR